MSTTGVGFEVILGYGEWIAESIERREIVLVGEGLREPVFPFDNRIRTVETCGREFCRDNPRHSRASGVESLRHRSLFEELEETARLRSPEPEGVCGFGRIESEDDAGSRGRTETAGRRGRVEPPLAVGGLNGDGCRYHRLVPGRHGGQEPRSADVVFLAERQRRGYDRATGMRRGCPVAVVDVQCVRRRSVRQRRRVRQRGVVAADHRGCVAVERFYVAEDPFSGLRRRSRVTRRERVRNRLSRRRHDRRIEVVVLERRHERRETHRRFQIVEFHRVVQSYPEALNPCSLPLRFE